jgi:hypothetical protein
MAAASARRYMADQDGMCAIGRAVAALRAGMHCSRSAGDVGEYLPHDCGTARRPRPDRTASR